MGIFEGIVTIAGAVTAVIGLVYYAISQYKKGQLEKRAKLDRELSEQIERAVTNAERQRLSEELDRLRRS
jgi:hypothetical protein